jgi:transcriptional regulator with XRE-family HTH domain
MDQIKIGEFITKLRKEKGLTQDELGEKLGISGKSVSKWERGIHLPDLNNLMPLAEILDVNVNDLLNGCVSNSTTDIDNATVVNNIKAYSNKYKRKYIFMF